MDIPGTAVLMELQFGQLDAQLYVYLPCGAPVRPCLGDLALSSCCANSYDRDLRNETMPPEQVTAEDPSPPQNCHHGRPDTLCLVMISMLNRATTVSFTCLFPSIDAPACPVFSFPRDVLKLNSLGGMLLAPFVGMAGCPTANVFPRALSLLWSARMWSHTLPGLSSFIFAAIFQCVHLLGKRSNVTLGSVRLDGLIAWVDSSELCLQPLQAVEKVRVLRRRRDEDNGRRSESLARGADRLIIACLRSRAVELHFCLNAASLKSRREMCIKEVAGHGFGG